MASIRKRGARWQAQVKVGSRRKSKTFSTKAAAVSWARDMEIELENAAAGRIPAKTFGDLLVRYSKEVTPQKRGAAREYAGYYGVFRFCSRHEKARNPLMMWDLRAYAG